MNWDMTNPAFLAAIKKTSSSGGGGGGSNPGFYVTRCTAGDTVWVADAYGDHGSNFSQGDIIIIGDSNNNYYCGTAGATANGTNSDYYFAYNNYDADCSACLSGGYGS